MGVKRQHTFEVIGPDRHLDQYVASFEHCVFVKRDGLPGRVKDFLDTNVPDDDWDWHFKIVGAVPENKTLHNTNGLEVDAYVSFRSKEQAFYFWWWLEQQDLQ